MVYSMGAASADFPTDQQFAQACMAINPVQGNQQLGLEG